MFLITALLLILAGAAWTVTVIATALGFRGIASRAGVTCVLCLVLWVVIVFS